MYEVGGYFCEQLYISILAAEHNLQRHLTIFDAKAAA